MSDLPDQRRRASEHAPASLSIFKPPVAMPAQTVVPILFDSLICGQTASQAATSSSQIAATSLYVDGTFSPSTLRAASTLYSTRAASAANQTFSAPAQAGSNAMVTLPANGAVSTFSGWVFEAAAQRTLFGPTAIIASPTISAPVEGTASEDGLLSVVIAGGTQNSFCLCEISVDGVVMAACSSATDGLAEVNGGAPTGAGSCIVPVPNGSAYAIRYTQLSSSDPGAPPWPIATSWTPLANSTLSAPLPGLLFDIAYPATTDGFIVATTAIDCTSGSMSSLTMVEGQVSCTVRDGAGVLKYAASTLSIVSNQFGPWWIQFPATSLLIPVSAGNQFVVTAVSYNQGTDILPVQSFCWIPISALPPAAG